MSRLSGKVAIITGGSQGMGAATAKEFVANGAQVVIGDVLDDKGESLAKELGENAIYVHLDVSSEADWQNAVDQAEKTFGKLNVLVNNAGILHAAPLAETSRSDYERVIAVNQVGPFLGMKAVIGPMRRAGVGSIVNISSFEGIQAKNGLIAYVASKWALRGMTKSAAIELGRFNIRVNSVHPGGIYTPMGGADPAKAEPDPAADAAFAKQPIPRMGRPEEVARVSVYLASDEASYTTGAEHMADGGWNAGLMFDLLPTTE